jgi:hypothetical protein
MGTLPMSTDFLRLNKTDFEADYLRRLKTLIQVWLFFCRTLFKVVTALTKPI